MLHYVGIARVLAKPGGGGVAVIAGKDSDDVPAGTLSGIRRATGFKDLR
jgi:hypothetical protein